MVNIWLIGWAAWNFIKKASFIKVDAESKIKAQDSLLMLLYAKFEQVSNGSDDEIDKDVEALEVDSHA